MTVLPAHNTKFIYILDKDNNPWYDGASLNNALFSIANWTLVPAETDAGTGLTFTHLQGQPNSTSAIFPQQFQELHDAINALTDRPKEYGVWLLDSTTSNTYITLANQVINFHDALFGATQLDPLKMDLQSGQADPGSVFTTKLVTDLQDAVTGIESKIYRRNSSGWVLNSGSMITFDQDASVAGKWSTPGPAIDPNDLSSIQTVVSAIVANGLYIAAPKEQYTIGGNNLATTQIYGAFPTDQPNPHWPSLTDWENAPYTDAAYINKTKNAFDGVGEISYSYVPPPNELSTSSGSENWIVSPFSLSVSVPAPTNPLGGQDMDSAVYPGYESATSQDDVKASTWKWGDQLTLVDNSADTLLTFLNYFWASAPGKVDTTKPVYQGTDMGSYAAPPGGAPSAPYVWFYDDITGGTNGSADYRSGIEIHYTPPPGLYGHVTAASNFSYTATRSKPAAPSVNASPTSPLPLTTQMDYQNVRPDTNMDGIVQVPTDIDSFGNDTGVIAYQADRDTPQVYLPLYTDATGALPIHNYIQQGAFAPAALDPSNPLLAPQTVQGAAGPSFDGSSLNTYVRQNLLINDASNHVKRVEVIRPGGNAVVFNFAWDAANNQFSTIGVPMGWQVNGVPRDANRTYVLRDLAAQDVSGLKYALEFTSGIVQTFNGTIQSVSNSQGLTQAISPSETSSRYAVNVNWSRNQISSVDYASKLGGETIHTAVTSSPLTGSITALAKSDAGANIPAFSYAFFPAVIGQRRILAYIDHNGVRTTRTGTIIGGSVTINVTTPSDPSIAAGTSTSETSTFNTNGLITSDALTLSEGTGQPSSTLTTAYAYGSGNRLTNGLLPTSQVTQIQTTVTTAGATASKSWEEFVYDSTTGWMTEDITPFKSNAWSPGGESNEAVKYLDYSGQGHFNQYGSPILAMGGQGADPMNWFEPPRMVTTSVLGTTTAIMLNKYGSSAGAGETTLITRRATSTWPADWADATFQTTTAISGYDSYLQISPRGSVSYSNSSAGVSLYQYWAGRQVAYSYANNNAFGVAASTSSVALGQAPTSTLVPTGSADAFGRPASVQNVNAGNLTANLSNYSWFGPQQVTDVDQSVTSLSYNPLGLVSDSNQTTLGLDTTDTYDAAGNVVGQKVTGTRSNQSQTTNASATYDVLGRMTSYTDPNGNTSSYVYTSDGTYNILTITNPDGGTEIDKYYLDGTLASVGGTAVTAATYNEGVLTQPSTDANGNWDFYAKVNSTWASMTSGGSSNTSISYTNLEGEQYLTQQTTPTTSQDGSVGLSTTDANNWFDVNGRLVKSKAVDGTVSHIVYDPATGAVGAEYMSMNPNGDAYVPGVDPKTVYHFVSQPTGPAVTDITTPVTNPATPSGVEVDQLASSGVQSSVSMQSKGGLGDVEIVNGFATTTTSAPSGLAGGWTDTASNPDGTKTIDTYVGGVLTDEHSAGTGGVIFADQGYGYDALARVTQRTNPTTGTLNWALFNDGSLASLTPPGHGTSAVDHTNPTTGDPTQITRADDRVGAGKDVFSPENTLGQTTSQSGAGVLGANFGYDSGTGMLNSLTTFQTPNAPTLGPVTGSGAATTSWAYDPATGQLQSKTYADGSQVQYQYNAQMQLKQLIEPGIGSSSFNYDGAGNLTNFSLSDSSTGPVTHTATLDELGRAVIAYDTDNANSSTESTAYWPAGQVKSQTYTLGGGSAGPVSLSGTYYDAMDQSANSSPGSLKTQQINLPDGTTQAQTTFNYNPSTKQLQTISVNGVAVQYTYLDDGQIGAINIGPADASGNLPQNAQVVSTTLTPDIADASRVGEIKVANSSGTVYDEAITGYFETDQREGEIVTRTNPDGTTQSDTLGYTYDPTQGDALTSVTDNGNVRSYAFDGAGNYTGSNPTASALGAANNLNQYATYTYNGRGDVTSNGTYTFGWDALDRLISVTPKTPSLGSLQVKLGYDSQNRWLWRDVYVWYNSQWVYAYSRHAVWDGSNLAGELDQNGKLVIGYTWGPSGLAAVTDYSPRTPKTYIPIIDGSGNTAMLVDPLSGSVVASYQYDPYGTLLSSSGGAAGVCPFLGKGLYAIPGIPGISLAQNRATDGKIWLSRDQVGEIKGGENLQSLYGNDPINNSDTTGTTYETVTGIVGIRWAQDGGAGHAEIGFEVTVLPSKWNYIFGVSDYDLAHPVGVRWVRVLSLPQQYASVRGLQQLAKASIGPQNNAQWMIQDAVALELEHNSFVQHGLTALKNAQGPTGLGPTGEGLFTAAMTTVLGGIIQGRSARANSGPGGPAGVQNAGRWETVNESMSPAARAYQAQVTGRTGQAYVVNGVKFDGVSAESLIDAKGPGYAWAVRNGVFRQGYRGAAELLDQAERQIGAARGLPITWHVAEPETVTAIQNLFKANQIPGITVVHTPVIP